MTKRPLTQEEIRERRFKLLKRDPIDTIDDFLRVAEERLNDGVRFDVDVEVTAFEVETFYDEAWGESVDVVHFTFTESEGDSTQGSRRTGDISLLTDEVFSDEAAFSGVTPNQYVDMLDTGMGYEDILRDGREYVGRNYNSTRALPIYDPTSVSRADDDFAWDTRLSWRAS